MRIPREQVIARVREAGFTFQKQGSRVEIFRQPGTKQRVDLPRRDLYEEKLVRVVLSQAGLTHQQIEGFLKAAIKQQ